MSMRFGRMPKPAVGDPVLWFVDGTREGPSLPGVALEVHEQSITIVVDSTIGQQLRDSVRYVEDPQLKVNEHIREFGAWDWTPFFKQVQTCHAIMEEVKATLARQTAKGRAAAQVVAENLPTEPSES